MKLRAVVLAAGLGTRLQPLTGTRPKPVLPVAGVPVAKRTLALLAEAGCETAAVNLHHLGDQVRAALGESVEGMPLVYSEEEEVQGTLGALWPLRDFCAAAELLLVINGDSLCRWPLKQLLRAHERGGAEATLLLSSRADPEEFGGGVGIGADDGIVTFGEPSERPVARRPVFAGAHAMAPRLLEGLQEGPAGFVEDLYQPLLDRGGRIAAVETSRPWHDLGTPERYRRAVLEHLFEGHPLRRHWTGPGARVEEGASLGRSVVESGGIVERGARLKRTLVLPGGRVGRDASLADCLVGFDARVPDGAHLAGQLITPAAASPGGGPLPAGSRVGDQLFTPLG